MTDVPAAGETRPRTLPAVTVLRWLLPISLLGVFAGYVGPWVDHKAAGLVVTGLDLGEYVKFLPVVRSGQVTFWREGFYLPLVTASLGASLIAFRAELRYAWPVRALLVALAIVAALNLLPPAWTPQRMMTDEFRQQALAIGFCLAAMVFSPLLALLPRKVTAVVIAVLGIAAAIVPVRQFLAVLPSISELYNRPQAPGWGGYLCVASLLALAAAALWFGWGKSPARE